ncbi:MAG: ABC transporter [Rhodospirillales bacterium RIFCSPLOWO2_12_FULL_58_28]|nr:MAG: ABC transporter [Rhodospirillales bacterium RIFCSPLOWO2_02_FULL_58_16]OHC78399.1 MAG: ABC transporter [Rhodospirillales bacterium RIFCSPLOWO2_12_FULL_58_28]
MNEQAPNQSGAVEIKIDGLGKSFGANHALRGIDLTIYRGDIIAVVGGSGCGKTVLLNHILGLLTADHGRVLVADHDSSGEGLVDISQLTSNQLDHICMHWGVVFQKNALFSGTVYDNIALWLSEVRNLNRREIKSIARSVLVSVGLDSGDDFLDLDVHDLSGGMAKRLAVARALAMKPAVIFYDEPTTGLDPTTSLQIHDLIVATHAGRPGRTTVIITHDKDLLIRLRPRTVMIHQGRVYFDGSLDEFERSDSPYIRPYFNLMPALQQGQKIQGPV